MTEKRFNIIKNELDFYFDVSDTEKRWEIGDVELDNLPVFEDLVDLLNDQNELIQELYDFRLLYNALLFNEWFKNDVCEVYKSLKHHDGEPCFDGEWFIVVAILPTGKQITNHYNIQDWDLFQIPEYPEVKDTFDGHTSKDVLKRLREIILK